MVVKSIFFSLQNDSLLDFIMILANNTKFFFIYKRLKVVCVFVDEHWTSLPEQNCVHVFTSWVIRVHSSHRFQELHFLLEIVFELPAWNFIYFHEDRRIHVLVYETIETDFADLSCQRTFESLLMLVKRQEVIKMRKISKDGWSM
jgi:hypothetical protein